MSDDVMVLFGWVALAIVVTIDTVERAWSRARREVAMLREVVGR